MSIASQELKIETQEQAELAATLFKPDKVKGAIMIAPATGIKRGFYKSLSTNLAELGYGVITYDNSGIGDSLKGDLRKDRTSIITWGEHDMPAIFKELKKQFPNTDYHLLGHSAGGQLVGLMPQCEELKSIICIACSSGRVKNMKGAFKIQAIFFMSIFIPLSNLLFGHTKSQWVGMGEPLPKKVARQWAEWCNGKGYIKQALGKDIQTHWYDELAIQSLWVNASDDTIANNKNVQEMIDIFPNITFKKVTLKPDEHNTKEIGHMKFFSKGNKHLWKLVEDWLAQKH